MEEAVIVSAVRTPVASFGRSLCQVPVVDLGVIALKEALQRIGLDAAQVDEVILGNVLQAGLGQNTARQVAVNSGLPKEVPAFTVNKVCASGLKSVCLAAQAIAVGEAEIIIAGGMENMSRVPYGLDGARWGQRMGSGSLVDLEEIPRSSIPMSTRDLGRPWKRFPSLSPRSKPAVRLRPEMLPE